MLRKGCVVFLYALVLMGSNFAYADQPSFVLGKTQKVSLGQQSEISLTYYNNFNSGMVPAAAEAVLDLHSIKQKKNSIEVEMTLKIGSDSRRLLIESGGSETVFFFNIDPDAESGTASLGDEKYHSLKRSNYLKIWVQYIGDTYAKVQFTIITKKD
ncbi:MAG: hypothetical protein ACPGO5_05330 [Patescibacteria group bacterium]